jgi:hypothetical protein
MGASESTGWARLYATARLHSRPSAAQPVDPMVALEVVRVIDTPDATHIRYRVRP